MELYDFLIICLTSGIVFLGIDYLIQAVVNNDQDMLGFNQDKATFGVFGTSTCLALVSDLLFYSDYTNRAYSAVIQFILLIVWIITLVFYFFREDHHSVGALGIEIKVAGKFNRNRDIARGVILVVLCGATALMHVLAESFSY